MFAKQAETLEKGFRSFENILFNIGLGMFFVLMLLGAFDVIGRYFLNKPILGATEFSQLLVGSMVFFAWGYQQAVKGHLRIDFFIKRFPSGARVKTELFTSFVFLAIFILFVWRAAVVAIEELRKGTFMPTALVNIPTAPFNFLVSFTALVVCLELIIQLVAMIRSMSRKN